VTGALPLVLWLGLGVPSALAFLRVGRRDLALAVTPLAGALAIVLPAILAPWTGGSLSGWIAHSALASLGLGLATGALLGRREDPSPEALPQSSSGSMALSLAVIVAVGAVLIGVGEILAQGWPGWGWDGLAIWIVRARVLAESDLLPVALFSEPQLREGHWDYPLALPALMAWYARVAGLGVQQMGVALAHLGALAPLVTALGLARVLGWPLAAAAGLAPLVVPELLDYHLRAYADPSLVMVATGAVAFTLVGTIRWDRGTLVLAGIAWALAVSIKNEGVLWLCAASVGSVLLSAYRERPRAELAAGLARLVVPGFALFAFWRLTCQRLGVEGTLLGGLRWDLADERFAPLTAELARHLFTPAVAPLLLVCIAVMAWRLRGPFSSRLLDAVVLLSIPLAYLAGLFVIYLATPHDLDWHVATSLHRTVYGVLPAVFVASLFAGSLGRDPR
jgi:hypothetical protein